MVLRAHVGRIDDTRWATMSDDELTAASPTSSRPCSPRFGTPADSLVQRWPDGLPQYDVGHERSRRTRARRRGAAIGCALAGNAYDGVGIPASIGSGRRAARLVLESFALAG